MSVNTSRETASESAPKSIWARGIWEQNPALVQLLGLCPLLAVSTSVITGLGLGLATLITVVMSSVVVSATRRYIPNEIRLPVFVLIIAAIVTAVDILGAAWAYDLHKTLGLFVP
ncbi:MAG: electron transport complex protein RnfE, partial [Gammaproteobacteria bacterium]